MTTYNHDGTPYILNGSLQQFGNYEPDKELFDQWDAESIEIGGSPIFYYEAFVQINNTADPLYMEDRGKVFSNNPVQLYCTYEPIASQNFINQFGNDSPDEMMFEFNYRSVLRTIGHPPKVGSRLYTPHLRENWVIIERKTGEYKMWGVIRLQVIAGRWQGDSAAGERGSAKQKNPDIKII